MEDRYKFITFEGIDGAGKDTQLYQLAEMIREDESFYGNKYHNVWITREPTQHSEPGRKICDLLKKDNISKEEATELFVSDRIEHSRVIEDVLRHSDVLLSRYDLSTLTYQYAQGMPLDELYNMHRYGERDGTIIPDITLFFDISAEKAAKRMLGRKSKEYFENLEFQRDVREKSYEVMDYLKKRDGRDIIVINAERPVDSVSQEMHDRLKQFFDNG